MSILVQECQGIESNSRHALWQAAVGNRSFILYKKDMVCLLVLTRPIFSLQFQNGCLLRHRYLCALSSSFGYVHHYP